MTWRKLAVNVFGVVTGIGSSTGAYIWYSRTKSNREERGENSFSLNSLPISFPLVSASWTTNFEPSVKWDDNWDRRAPKSCVKPLKNDATQEEKENYQNKLKESTPTVSRHLILIRHGQYNMNGEEDHERILTALGREQAHMTGKRLKELDFAYTSMISSTMARALETAQIIHQVLPDVPYTLKSDLLREGAPIPPEPPVGHWKPEARQFQEDGSRIEAAFRKFIHRADAKQTKDSYEIMVFHANVIRYFVCRALQLPPEAWLRISLHNCSITLLTVRPNGRVVLRLLGDCGHIPSSKLSTT